MASTPLLFERSLEPTDDLIEPLLTIQRDVSVGVRFVRIAQLLETLGQEGGREWDLAFNGDALDPFVIALRKHPRFSS